jgi:hypothetical protein
MSKICTYEHISNTYARICTFLHIISRARGHTHWARLDAEILYINSVPALLGELGGAMGQVRESPGRVAACL